MPLAPQWLRGRNLRMNTVCRVMVMIVSRGTAKAPRAGAYMAIKHIDATAVVPVRHGDVNVGCPFLSIHVTSTIELDATHDEIRFQYMEQRFDYRRRTPCYRWWWQQQVHRHRYSRPVIMNTLDVEVWASDSGASAAEDAAENITAAADNA